MTKLKESFGTPAENVAAGNISGALVQRQLWLKPSDLFRQLEFKLTQFMETRLDLRFREAFFSIKEIPGRIVYCAQSTQDDLKLESEAKKFKIDRLNRLIAEAKNAKEKVFETTKKEIEEIRRASLTSIRQQMEAAKKEIISEVEAGDRFWSTKKFHGASLVLEKAPTYRYQVLLNYLLGKIEAQFQAIKGDAAMKINQVLKKEIRKVLDVEIPDQFLPSKSSPTKMSHTIFFVLSSILLFPAVAEAVLQISFLVLSKFENRRKYATEVFDKLLTEEALSALWDSVIVEQAAIPTLIETIFNNCLSAKQSELDVCQRSVDEEMKKKIQEEAQKWDTTSRQLIFDTRIFENSFIRKDGYKLAEYREFVKTYLGLNLALFFFGLLIDSNFLQTNERFK
jgi:hypothetical protein